VTVNGVDDGRPMVFIHGFGCDQAMWRHVAPAFEDRFRTVQYDLAGFGGSASGYDPQRHESLEGYAADLLAIIDELDLREVIVVAHSVSAMITVLAAVEAPERFAGLVLVCPSPRYIDDPDTGYVGGFSRADIDELLETLGDNFVAWSMSMAPAIMGNPDRPELGQELTASFCRADPAVAVGFARTTFLSDTREALGRVRVPTLVLQTTRDMIADVPVGEYVRDHVPDSQMVLLDAEGHCPNLSAPGPTTAAIEDFVGQLG